MIKAVTWGWNSCRDSYTTEEAKVSLSLLLSEINLSHVILAFSAVQDTAFSTDIDYKGIYTPSLEEIRLIIKEVHKNNKKVILKPTVNCLDGTWRAHINFFDIDVPCEPKWSEWFESYENYILEFAKLAEEESCEMFVIGCEMVQSDRREREWRNLIKKVRNFYSGNITYNCDKYQENNITWWDAVDYISSSGYYPINSWEENLERIKNVVDSCEKPSMFMEVGCPSIKGNAKFPNRWDMEKIPDMEEQQKFYEEMFLQSEKIGFVSGYGLWDWPIKIYEKEDAYKNCDYSFYGKPAEITIKKYFSYL